MSTKSLLAWRLAWVTSGALTMLGSASAFAQSGGNITVTSTPTAPPPATSTTSSTTRTPPPLVDTTPSTTASTTSTTGSTTAGSTSGNTTAGTSTTANANTERPPEPPPRLLDNDKMEYSIGARAGVFIIPAAFLRLFANLEDTGWNGSIGLLAGGEFRIRNTSGGETVLGLQYVGHSASRAIIRGLDENPESNEAIVSGLSAVYFTAHYLFPIRIAKAFEIQIGGGIGLGLMLGDLNRTQVYPVTDRMGNTTWTDCRGAGMAPMNPAAGPTFCDNANAHYPNAMGQNYVEGKAVIPNPMGASPGTSNYVPLLMPWVSLPHIAFHFRPHRHFDFKIEGGYAVIGFYAGGSLSAIF